jgi:hypothetical protein
MILLKILDHDLHRPRSNVDAIPLAIEVPARPEFLPAIISGTRAQFLTSRRIFNDRYIRVGMFPHDSDRIDDVIEPMIRAAYELSVAEQWVNIFSGRGSLTAAYNFVRYNSGLKTQPHMCLVPDSWTIAQCSKRFGKAFDSKTSKFHSICHVVPSKVHTVTFLSRPDMVGMYTQILGGNSGIILHNIRMGMSFLQSET